MSPKDKQYYQANRIEQMNPDFVGAFIPMAQEFYEKTGRPLRVTDTYRTYDEQADLYQRKPGLAAPPGKSRHEVGEAMDINTEDIPDLERLGLIEKYGFHRPVLHKGETWHIERAGGGSKVQLALEAVGWPKEAGAAAVAPTGRGGGHWIEEGTVDAPQKPSAAWFSQGGDWQEVDTSPTWRQAPPPSLFERLKEYLGLNYQRKTTPMDLEAADKGLTNYDIREQVFGTGRQEELRRVVGQFASGITGGMTDALDTIMKGDIDRPESLLGAFAGGVAGVGGFVLGPAKLAHMITGGWAAPTEQGLQTVAHILTKGGATLGLATGISSIIPHALESNTFSEYAIDIAKSTGVGAIAGALFPGLGMIAAPAKQTLETVATHGEAVKAVVSEGVQKVLRMATGFAAMDFIRAGKGKWSTIPDVVKGIKDGTIDKKVLGELVSGYMFDLYFSAAVKPMHEQLVPYRMNALIKEIADIKPKDAEQAILMTAGKAGQKAKGAEKEITPFEIPSRAFVPERKPSEVAIIKSEPTPEIKKPTLNAAFKLKNGSIIDTGKIHELPKEIKIDEVADVGFINKKTGEYLTRSEAAKAFSEYPNKVEKGKLHSSDIGKKQAWTLSKDQWSELYKGDQDKSVFMNLHLKSVDQALLEGKPVPPEVLADYPDLAAKYGKPGAGEKAESIGTEGMIQARKNPAGHYQLFYRGTRNEIFPGEKFNTANEARQYWKAEKAKIDQAGASGDTVMGLTFPGINRLIARAKEKLYTPTNPNAIAVKKMFEEARQKSHDIRHPGFKAFYAKMKQALVDVSGNLSKKLLASGDPFMKEAVMRFDLVRGATAKADVEWTKKQDEIYKDLSPAEEDVLNEIITSRRIIAIEQYKKIRHPGGLGENEHIDALNDIPPALFRKLNDKANSYFRAHDELLQDKLAEGLITQEQFNGLQSKGDYSPRWYLQHLDPERTYTVDGQKVTVRDSGIKKLDEGSIQMMEVDSRMLLSHAVKTHYARVFKNRANLALLEVARNVRDNGIVEIGREAKPGESTISAMENGKKVDMVMPNQWAREWIKSDPEISQGIATFFGWASGAKILRAMATGLNPEFALTNMPRDIALVLMTSKEYSPVFPKAMAQLTTDFKEVAMDAIMRRGAYQDYINEGGGMEFLTMQGKVTSRIQGPIGDIQKVMGYFGNTSEIITRLALRNRAIKNGKSPEEATWEARNYLDFSKGGSFTKAVDTAWPYLNASVQGTRAVFRAAHNDPGRFAFVASQIGALASGLYLANYNLNKDALDQIPDREKVGNWIVTTPWSYTDKNGDRKPIYFKIPKDQGQRIIATIFENMMAKLSGEKIDVDQVTMAAQDLIKLGFDQMMPAQAAYFGYMTNKDFWMNRDIWRGPKVKPEEEYTKTTHPALVEFGKYTGMSPERTGYALSQFFTRGNIYTSLVSGGAKAMMVGWDQTMKDMWAGDAIKQVPFLRKFVAGGDERELYKESLQELKLDENTRRFKQRRELDALMDAHFEDKTNKENQKAVRDYIKAAAPEDRQRLTNEAKQLIKFESIPNRTWPAPIWATAVARSSL